MGTLSEGKTVIPIPSWRPSAAFIRDVLSIAAPGFLLVCELAALTLPTSATQSLQDAATYFSGLGSPGIVGGTVLLVAFAFASYVLGVAVRQLIFALLPFVAPHRQLTLAEIRTDLETRFGEERVRNTLRETGVWAELPAVAGTAGPTASRGILGGLLHPPYPDSEGKTGETDMDSARGHVFAYCKYWLRYKTPALGVDPLETQIYLHSTLPMTFVLAIGVSLKLLMGRHEPDLGLWIIWALGSAFAVYVSFVFLRSAAELRSKEASQAMRNFLFAHWWREAAPPASATPVESAGAE